MNWSNFLNANAVKSEYILKYTKHVLKNTRISGKKGVYVQTFAVSFETSFRKNVNIFLNIYRSKKKIHKTLL